MHYLETYFAEAELKTCTQPFDTSTTEIKIEASNNRFHFPPLLIVKVKIVHTMNVYIEVYILCKFILAMIFIIIMFLLIKLFTNLRHNVVLNARFLSTIDHNLFYIH